MRLAGVLAGAVGLVLASAGPAAGAVVATGHDAQWAPVIEGDAIVWVERARGGDLLVRRVVPGSAPADVMRAELPDEPHAIQAPLRLSAGPAGVALLRTVQTYEQTSSDSGTGMHLFDDLLLAPPDGPPRKVDDAPCGSPADVAVTDVLVTISQARTCDSPYRAVVKSGERLIGDSRRLIVTDVAAEGRFVAWRRHWEFVGGPDQIVVFDLEANRIAYRVDLRPLDAAELDYDLDPDGAVAISYETRPIGLTARTRLGIAVADAADPVARRPPAIAVTGARSRRGRTGPAEVEIAADAGRIAFVREARNGDAQAVVAARDGRVLAVHELAPRRLAHHPGGRGPRRFQLGLFIGLDLKGPTLAATVSRRLTRHFPWLRSRDSRVLAWRV